MFFEVKTQLTNHVLMVVPAAAIGIICGVGAILFTIINLKVGSTVDAAAGTAGEPCYAGLAVVQPDLPMCACCHLHVCWSASCLQAGSKQPAIPARFLPRALPQVTRARSEFFKGRPAKWRMAEPCLLIIIFVTLGMILPLFFPCTPTQVRCHPARCRGIAASKGSTPWRDACAADAKAFPHAC